MSRKKSRYLVRYRCVKCGFTWQQREMKDNAATVVLTVCKQCSEKCSKITHMTATWQSNALPGVENLRANLCADGARLRCAGRKSLLTYMEVSKSTDCGINYAQTQRIAE